MNEKELLIARTLAVEAFLAVVFLAGYLTARLTV